MTRKEVFDNLLKQIAEDKKDAFVTAIKEAKDKAQKIAILEKYGVSLSEEERSIFENNSSKELSDDDLEMASGGGCKGCKCGGSCSSLD